MPAQPARCATIFRLVGVIGTFPQLHDPVSDRLPGTTAYDAAGSRTRPQPPFAGRGSAGVGAHVFTAGDVTAGDVRPSDITPSDITTDACGADAWHIQAGGSDRNDRTGTGARAERASQRSARHASDRRIDSR